MNHASVKGLGVFEAISMKIIAPIVRIVGCIVEIVKPPPTTGSGEESLKFAV